MGANADGSPPPFAVAPICKRLQKCRNFETMYLTAGGDHLKK
jgi:hypothetical protein